METLWFSIYSIILSAYSGIIIYIDQRYWPLFFFFFLVLFLSDFAFRVKVAPYNQFGSDWKWKNESESHSGSGAFFFSILGNSLRKIDIDSSLYVWWHSPEDLWYSTFVWEVLIIDSVSILVSDLFKLSISS